MGGWQEGESEPGLCRSAPSVPPALPLTLGLCPFSHPCSEEAKSTTWLHPVTGEAVVTGHRRHSTGNAEPGRARAELGSVGRRRQNPGRQPSGNLPRTAVPGRRRGGAEVGEGGRRYKDHGVPAAGVLSSLWTFLLSAAFHHHLETAPSSSVRSPISTWTPPMRLGCPNPLSQEIWNSEFFFLQPLPNPPPTSPPSILFFRPHLFSTFRSPFLLPSLQPGTLPVVRQDSVFTSSPSSQESCPLLCSFLLLLGGICGLEVD